MARDTLLIKWVGAMLGRGTMPLGEIMDAAMAGFPGGKDARAIRQDQADGRFGVQSLDRGQVARDGQWGAAEPRGTDEYRQIVNQFSRVR
jgi:hypothetical protein